MASGKCKMATWQIWHPINRPWSKWLIEMLPMKQPKLKWPSQFAIATPPLVTALWWQYVFVVYDFIFTMEYVKYKKCTRAILTCDSGTSLIEGRSGPVRVAVFTGGHCWLDTNPPCDQKHNQIYTDATYSVSFSFYSQFIGILVEHMDLSSFIIQYCLFFVHISNAWDPSVLIFVFCIRTSLKKVQAWTPLTTPEERYLQMWPLPHICHSDLLVGVQITPGILRFFAQQGRHVARWRLNWCGGRLLHAMFYLRHCRGGEWKPEADNFIQFWNINAPQGCISCMISTKFLALWVASFWLTIKIWRLTQVHSRVKTLGCFFQIFSVSEQLNCKTDVKMFSRCRNGMDVLYHHAEFGVAGTLPPHYGEVYVLFMCLSCFWTVEFVLTTLPNRHSKMEIVLRLLGRGRFPFLHPNSILSLHHWHHYRMLKLNIRTNFFCPKGNNKLIQMKLST